MLTPTADPAERLRAVQIKGSGRSSSASLAGLQHSPCPGHSCPAWHYPAQQGRPCSWGQAGRHGAILPLHDPTPGSHLSHTITAELEIMQLHWRSQNSKRHDVWSRTTQLQRKCQDNSSTAELVAGSCPVAAVTNATLQQESPASLKTLSLLNKAAGNHLIFSWDSFIHQGLQVSVNDHHLLETNWKK